jgi:hypothetical protein
VTAVYCAGKKYRYHTCQATATSFTGSMLKVTHQYRVYIDLLEFGEQYEIVQPVVSVHNLVIGTLYLDLGESLLVKCLTDPSLRADVKFERRGWFSKEDAAYKFGGDVYRLDGKKKNVAYSIAGHWNRGATLTNVQT